MKNAISLICRAVLAAGLALPSIQGWACHPDEVSQLRVGNFKQLARDAFPALSSNGEEVAMLVAPDPMAEGIDLELRFVDNGELAEKYTLISLHESTDQQGLEAAMAEPNKYLRVGSFRSMEPLFLLPYDKERPNPPQPTFEHSRAELQVSVNYDTSVVTLSVANTNEVLLRKEPATRVFAGIPDVCEPGTIAGTAHAGWIDYGRRVAVFQYRFIFSSDSCDLPEIWHVVRLEAAR